MIRERERMVAGLLSSTGFQPLHRRRILEVGCGSGNVLRGLLSMGANPENCDGLDLRPEQIAVAKRACADIRFVVGNAADPHTQMPASTSSSCSRRFRPSS